MTPLTSVVVLARHEPRVASHVSRLSAFLDASARVSQEQALALARSGRGGSAALLARVLARAFETAESSAESLVLSRWVWAALLQQLTPHDAAETLLPVVKCLATFVHPSRSLWDAVARAVAATRLDAARWLYQAASQQQATAASPSTATNALLREAVATGDVVVTRWVLDHWTAKAPKPALDVPQLVKALSALTQGGDAAALDARWALVELLYERLGPLAHRSLPRLAAQQGRLATLRVMRAHGETLDLAVANAAAARGHLDIVAFVGLTPSSAALDDAALDGDVALLQTLHAEFQCELTAAGVLRAADKGHVAALQWAWAAFPTQSYWSDLDGLLVPALTAAVEAGRLEALRWLYETHLERVLATRAAPERRVLRAESVYLAFQHRCIDVVKFVHAHGLLDWDHWEGGNAAFYCELPTIRWLHEHNLMGAPRNELTSAVYAGRLDYVQWILDNRAVEPATYAVEYAALHGRMDILELLLARGLSYTSRAIDFAASKGHVEAIRRLAAHRRSQGEETTDGASPAALHGACLAGHLGVVRQLTETPVRGGTCTTAAMDAAASKGFLDVVQYLHAHRTEGCTTAAMDAAATNGDLAMVQFLHTHRTEGCSSSALEGAAVNGHAEIVQFLVAHYPHVEWSPAIAKRARARGEVEIALWLEQQASAAVTPAGSAAAAASLSRRRASCPTVPLEAVLPPATPIAG